MDIKVGDIVKCQEKTVRIMQSDGDSIQLAGCGWFEKNDPGIKLVESVKLPQLRDGDCVIVHDIPKIEKDYYGTSWTESMDDYVGKTVHIHNPHTSYWYGDVVTIGSWTFQTYHLEKIDDYDIV